MSNKLSRVRCYLNNRVNVENNPFDNLYLYKHHLRGIDESNPEFYSKERMDEYIKHMHKIGWFQHPLCEEKNLAIYPGNNMDKIIKFLSKMEG